MTSEKRRFVNLDTLGENFDTRDLLTKLGVPPDVIQSSGNEIRTACFLQCGKAHPTGNRAIAIRDDSPAKLWKCHDYNCQHSGNLVSLVSLAIGGPARPRGDDFWKVIETIEAIRNGDAPTEAIEPATDTAPRSTESAPPKQPKATTNVPLDESDNERVRAVAKLYKKLTLDLSRMPPRVSRYVRSHSFLTDEVAQNWGLGYLARDTGGDRSGGTMRGKFVATIRNREGQVVGYAGRDCEWEQKHQLWIAGGREGKEPAKWMFPKNFIRGVELFGADRIVSNMHHAREKLQAIGLPVVEGVMDAINLHTTLDTPAVSILSNQGTDHQLEQIAELAYTVGNGAAVLLYDCDVQGENGMDLDTIKLSKLCRVQRGWSRDMYGGEYTDMDPAQLTAESWQPISAHLRADNGAVTEK